MRTKWLPISEAPKDGRSVRVRRLLDGRTIYDGPAMWARHVTGPLIDPITKKVVSEGSDEMAWVYPHGHHQYGYRVPEPTHFTEAG